MKTTPIKLIFVTSLLAGCSSFDFGLLLDVACASDPVCATSEHSPYTRELRKKGYDPIAATKSQSTYNTTSQQSSSSHPCASMMREGKNWLVYTCSAPGRQSSEHADCVSSYDEQSHMRTMESNFAERIWTCSKNHSKSRAWGY